MSELVESLHGSRPRVAVLGARFFLLIAIAVTGCSTSRPLPAPALEPLHVFLLAGQSNMAGRGVVDSVDRVVHPRLLMLDRSGAWVPAIDPVHFDKSVAGVGPSRSFGLAVAGANPNGRIGLVPAAVGGSPIRAWEPGAFDSATQTHPYDDAIARARTAMKSGELRAILWHQGESDGNAESAPLYGQRLRALIERFRRDLGNPALPVLIGQLGRFDGVRWSPARERVDSAHRAIARDMPNVAFVSSDGLQHKGDQVHFSAASARELGMRYAEAWLRLSRR